MFETSWSLKPLGPFAPSAPRCRVEAAAPDLVATRPGQDRETGPGQERRRKKERCPDLGCQARIGPGLAQAAGVDRDRVLLRPVDGDAKSPDQFDQGSDVTDARDVLDHHRAGCEQSGREEGKGLVLVPARDDVAAERVAALDYEAVPGRRIRRRHRQGVFRRSLR